MCWWICFPYQKRAGSRRFLLVLYSIFCHDLPIACDAAGDVFDTHDAGFADGELALDVDEDGWGAVDAEGGAGVSCGFEGKAGAGDEGIVLVAGGKLLSDGGAGAAADAPDLDDDDGLVAHEGLQLGDGL